MNWPKAHGDAASPDRPKGCWAFLVFSLEGVSLLPQEASPVEPVIGGFLCLGPKKEWGLPSSGGRLLTVLAFPASPASQNVFTFWAGEEKVGPCSGSPPAPPPLSGYLNKNEREIQVDT